MGLQFVSENWLTDAINAIKARNGEAVFGRTFFMPHSYGMNHPPELHRGHQRRAQLPGFGGHLPASRSAFVPPMIVGEGGWKWGATDDARFPKVTDDLHRDYYVRPVQLFSTGIMPNGEPLPDYLFGFCPWLIAHKMDDNAFYDSLCRRPRDHARRHQGHPPVRAPLQLGLGPAGGR